MPDPHARHQEFLQWAFTDLARADALLVQCPELVRSRSSIGETPLHYLAVENQIAAVELLLRRGSDVNTRNDFEGTPLHDAASLGYEGMVRLLLRHGADVNAANKNDETPLHQSVSGSEASIEIVRLLLETGADVNALDLTRETALDSALKHGLAEAAALLRAAGAEEPRDRYADPP